MAGRSSGILATLTRHRRVGLFRTFESFIRRMPPSDKAIAAVLALAFALVSLTSLVALERTVLVPIPVRGGSFTEGVVGNPRFVNPLLALTDADRDLTALTYAGLMGNGPDGLRPVMAQSYTVSPDGKTYTFVLRNGITFSDGTPVTAEDVVFTIEKAQDPALKSPALANWANIRVEAVDARTVRFLLPKAYAPFLEDATIGILPEHLWAQVPDAQFPFSKYMEEPVGAGPFRVSSVSRDSDGVITEYSLAANPSYALGRPYLNGITFRFFASSDELSTAYKHGDVGSAYGIPAKGALTAPYSRVFGVFFNQTNVKAFGAPEMREALSVAIDRGAIASDILGGYAVPLDGPVPPGSGITEPKLPTGDRVASAEKLLTDAGWTYASTTQTWSNAKQKLSLSSVAITTSNVPELKAVASEIERDWESIGIPTSLTLVDPNALVPTVIRPRAYDALYFGMVIGSDQDLFPFWDSSQKQDPGLNIAMYANKSVDALLEKARQENDPGTRLAELQKASDLISADYPAAFTHAPDFVYAAPKGVQGIELPQITAPADRFANVEAWHMNTEWVWPFLAKWAGR